MITQKNENMAVQTLDSGFERISKQYFLAEKSLNIYLI
jgi:hypothetical protein